MKRALLFASLPLAGCGRPGSGPCPSNTATYYVSPADLGSNPSCAQLCYIAMQTSEGGGGVGGTGGGPLYTTIVGCDASAFDLGVMHVDCTTSYPCGTGRRPAEIVRAEALAREAVGRWLADAAQLEAASVPAFEILAAELRAHDAPPSLVARALASADDEQRHARIMTSLARAHGARPGPVRVVVREPRELEAIARENAVEGLVREAYGARIAIDPGIGVDEQRHAELAADVHDWIRPRLQFAARRRVDEARDAARAQLVAECAVELPRAVRDALGLPDAGPAVELARLV
jgi:hypothetical protein